MSSIRHYRILTWLCGIALIVLLAACGSSPTTGNPTPTTPATASTPGATATLSGGHPPVFTPTAGTTAPEPPTLTSCPAAGTARAAILAHLALGNHPNIVYTYNQYQGATPTPSFATLRRYDVTTGATTSIVKLPGNISYAQISADGQWILFVSTTSFTSGTQKLQLVRMDGQGLQTLYCSSTPNSSIQTPQWSTNQKYIVFASSGNQMQVVYLLDTTSGKLQSELTATFANSGGVTIRTWLDNTRIYLTNTQIDQPPNKVYILDISKGANQNINNLPVVVNQTFGDFDSSYNGSQLFVDYGLCGQGGCYPPGRIVVKPASGGTETTILNSPKYDTTGVRSITASTLLVEISNSAVFGQQVDMSHNGLWKMNADGTGLTGLYIDQSHESSNLNSFSQYPWSNVSRDDTMYALQVINTQGKTPAFALRVGSLNGGPTTTFASSADGSDLSVAGWTTM